MMGRDGRRRGLLSRFRYPFLAGLLAVDLAAIILLSVFNYRVFYVESRSSYEENFISYERNVTYMAFNNIENQLASYLRIPDLYFASVPQNDAMLRPQREDIIGVPEHVKALTDLLFTIRGTYSYLYSIDIYYENTGTAITGFENIHEVDDIAELHEILPWMSFMQDDAQACLLPLGRNSYPTAEPVITYIRRIPYQGWGDIYVALHILPSVISAFITEDAIHSFCLTDNEDRLIYGETPDIGSVLSLVEDTREAKADIGGEERIIFSYVFPDSGLRYTYLINYSLFGQLGFDQDRQLMILFIASIVLNILVLSGLTYLNYVIYRRHIHSFSEKAGLPVSGEGIDASLSSMAAQIMNLHHTAESAKELRLINIVRSIVLSKDGGNSYPQIYERFAGRYVRCCIIESEGREGDLMANMLNEQFKNENADGNVSVLCTFISPKNVVVLIVVDAELHMLDAATEKAVALSGELNVDISRLVPAEGNGFRESFLSAQEVARYRFLYQSRILSYDQLGIAGRRNSGNHVKFIEQLEKDLNSRQPDMLSSHLSLFLDELRDGGYNIQYCISAISDIAVAIYGYMLRSQLDTWIVFGYDIREYAKQAESLDSFRAWIHQVIDTVYRSIKLRDESIDSDIKQQIEIIISNEIENDISLSMIADKLCMKPYELSRMFSKIMGKNYIDYIKDRKLMKAVEFLRDGMAVQDIAKRLGYRSSQYFIRIFKENYGTTPYQYKKTVLDTEES